ncbi:hypothetical protein AAV94_11205 [Lampropedia cohaerens]|uniref:Protein TolA n=1 Tax=Lampropedia cohaerens TaxID=1610491 RepID=A0A0U1PXZ7_9BURK|nr:hypothetical protein AAV94_11205 [Lampropedia cohaerens]
MPPISSPSQVPLTPPPQRMPLRAVAWAVLVHVGLIAAFMIGASFKRPTETLVAAELWSALPQQAAPAAASAQSDGPTTEPAESFESPQPQPTSAPQPVEEPAPEPDPELVLQEERRKRELAKQAELRRKAQEAQAARQKAQQQEAERKKAQEAAAAKKKAEEEAAAQKKRAEEEATKQKKAAEAAAAKKKAEQEAAAKKKKAEQEAAAKKKREAAEAEARREAELQRIQSLAGATGATGSTGTAAQTSGPSAGYAGQVIARVRPHIQFPGVLVGNPTAVVEVRVDSAGRITSRRVMRSSGNVAWDDAVLRALDAAETLPKDNGRVHPVLTLEFSPNG